MDAENSKKRRRGKAFLPGQSGNPGGRPKLGEVEKAVKAMTREQYASLQQIVMTKRKEELEDLIASGLPFEEELFIRHVLTLGENPNMIAYQKYLDRRVGPVTQEIDITTKLGSRIINLPQIGKQLTTMDGEEND